MSVLDEKWDKDNRVEVRRSESIIEVEADIHRLMNSLPVDDLSELIKMLDGALFDVKWRFTRRCRHPNKYRKVTHYEFSRYGPQELHYCNRCGLGLGINYER